MTDRFRSLFRASPWLGFALVATLIVGVLHPHQIGVLVWSLCKLGFGAYLAYWIDRTIYPYARPHAWLDETRPVPWDELVTAEASMLARIAMVSLCMLRRALIMAATIVALGLGV